MLTMCKSEVWPCLYINFKNGNKVNQLIVQKQIIIRREHCIPDHGLPLHGSGSFELFLNSRSQVCTVPSGAVCR